MNRRLIAFALLFCACLCVLSAAEDTHYISLFINDGAYARDEILPFIESDGKYLVPLDAFDALDALSVTQNDALAAVLLQSEDGKFLSFSLQNGQCLDERGQKREVTVYRYGDGYYIEPDFAAEKFDLSFATAYAQNGKLCARLCDGKEALTFDELLNLYAVHRDNRPTLAFTIPARKTVSGVFMHPIFLRPSVTDVQKLLALAGRHGTTFALSPADVRKFAAVLPDILGAGHAISYYMPEGESGTAFAAEMEESNRFLFSLLGVTVRTYVSPALYKDIPKIDGYFAKSCRMHLLSEDLASERMVQMVLHDSPSFDVYNFSLATDAAARAEYAAFFAEFDKTENLRSMPLGIAAATQ